jgi:hypothetical protein
MADPERYDAIVVTNLCVPTASGVPLRLLPDEINGVRIVGIDVPGFGVPTHAEAKDVLAGAMLNYARQEVEAGPFRPLSRVNQTVQQSRCWAKCSLSILLESEGCSRHSVWRQVRSFPAVSGVSSMPRWIARWWPRSTPSTRAAIREFEAAGRTIVGSAPGRSRRHRRLACRDRGGLWRRRRQGRRRAECLPARHQGRACRDADQGHHHAVGLRRLRASGRAPADRERGGRRLMSALPARRRNGPRRTSNGSKPVA